jgi:hypothetical protein
MDPLWTAATNFIEQNIHLFPHVQHAVEILMDDETAPNVLLYGPDGMPHDMIWEFMIRRKHGPFTKATHMWGKEWLYHETPYFFEIDLKHPSQPKSIASLPGLLKEIITHPCLHATRHTIFLRNVEVLAQKSEMYAFRVLLERYSHNAWFVCSTHHIGIIESPIRSRFLGLRVPSFTSAEIHLICEHLGIALPDPQCRHLGKALFASICKSHGNPLPVDRYEAPLIHTFLNAHPSPSIHDIRVLTQQLSVHGFTLPQIAKDLLYHVSRDKRSAFLQTAASIDHMCATTEGYRKPLYIEWLVHNAIYGKNANK